MAEYQLPKIGWARAVTAAFVILIAAAIAALFVFAPKSDTPPAAEPAPAATQPVEQPAPEPAAPADPAPTQAPEPKPTETTTPSVPKPKYTRDELNILGQAIWDAFGEDVVLSNGGVQYPDANYNTKVIRPYDPAAEIGDEKPLNIQGSNWVVRVTESDAKNGTVWSIIT